MFDNLIKWQKSFPKKIDFDYPISSFLVKPGIDKPYVELSRKEKASSDKQLFSRFVEEFSDWISKQ